MDDLFEDIVDRKHLHPNYTALKQPDRTHLANVIREWATGFVDRDGNDKFRKEFQTTFNSSFWELYLFAIFKKLNINIDLSFNAPDFCFTDIEMTVEAVISNAAAGDTHEWEKTFEGVAHADVLTSQAITIERLSNSIFSKSEKYIDSYSQLPQCENKAFVLAVGSYATEDFFQIGDVAMQRLLYDDDREGSLVKRNGSSIELGIFKSDQFKHISAVAFSSTATMGKTRALSKVKNPAMFQATRIKNLIEPIRIAQNQDEYSESLADGLRIFHNPNAAFPIAPETFASDEDIMQFCFDSSGEGYCICSPRGDLAMRQVQVLNFIKTQP